MAKLKRGDLQALARVRLNEARLLMDGGGFAGAYYLTGLAVEYAFKACIARSTEEFEFPDCDHVRDSWSHDDTTFANSQPFRSAYGENSHRRAIQGELGNRQGLEG